MRRRNFMKGAIGTAALAVPTLGAFGAATAHAAPTLPAKQAIIEAVRKVNDHWIGENSDPGSNEWDRATYFSGCMAAHRLTGEQSYVDYAEGWADGHGYDLVEGSGTRSADNQCAGQAYLDLFEIQGGEDRIAAVEESVYSMVTDEQSDDWWWVDALHMAMPLFVRLGVLRKDPAYFAKLAALYAHTKTEEGGGLWDAEASMWYRDADYSPGGGNTQSPNGKPVFWSRGNGWALAAYAKALAVLPADAENAREYRDSFVALANSVRAVQREDGFWNPSLGDPDHLPGQETSGTALFTYGMAYGISAGLLDRNTFLPTVASAWNGMVTDAVHEDGFLGFVQGIGYEPESSQPITYDSTTDFGVGAFLLAGSAVAKLAA